MTDKIDKEKIVYKTIHIDSSLCFFCGQPFGAKELRKTEHHGIPKCLSPERNIGVPVHKKCHDEINSLYVVQQKRPRVPQLKAFENQMAGILKNAEGHFIKVSKLHSRIIKEINKTVS